MDIYHKKASFMSYGPKTHSYCIRHINGAKYSPHRINIPYTSLVWLFEDYNMNPNTYNIQIGPILLPDHGQDPMCLTWCIKLVSGVHIPPNGHKFRRED